MRILEPLFQLSFFLESALSSRLRLCYASTYSNVCFLAAKAEGIPTESQILVYAGVPLEDDVVICSQVPEEGTVSVSVGVPGGALGCGSGRIGVC